MDFLLTSIPYGKSGVRLTKVERRDGSHDLKEVTVDVGLDGDFADSYTRGDNSKVIATDSMKNLVYILAESHPLRSVEEFGAHLASHLLEKYHHVSRATIRMEERRWERILVDDSPHPHAFRSGGEEKWTCKVTLGRSGPPRVDSGLAGLTVLKTTGSGFSGFLRDEYTTLEETRDRILATVVDAEWTYRNGATDEDWIARREAIRRVVLATFAAHESLSVQQTLHAMGEAALRACEAVEEIRLSMPNKHYLRFDFTPFGGGKSEDIFVPTDEPYGVIHGTLRRDRPQ